MSKLLKSDFSEYDNFKRHISYYYQIDSVVKYCPKDDKILEIGVGNKTTSSILKNKGYNVKTFDIQEDLCPDFVGDIHSLPFPDNFFDTILIYQVLEHLLYSDLENVLKELNRVAKGRVFVSVPYWNASFETIIKFPGIGKFKEPPFLRVHLEIPYMRRLKSKEHYYELGARGYPVRKFRKDLSKYFTIFKEFTVPINNHHRFFLCDVK